eukprot:scaffold7053_cov380-Pinguiococcus_pyrenoidosus.AAC.8
MLTRRRAEVTGEVPASPEDEEPRVDMLRRKSGRKPHSTKVSRARLPSDGSRSRGSPPPVDGSRSRRSPLPFDASRSRRSPLPVDASRSRTSPQRSVAGAGAALLSLGEDVDVFSSSGEDETSPRQRSSRKKQRLDKERAISEELRVRRLEAKARLEEAELKRLHVDDRQAARREEREERELKQQEERQARLQAKQEEENTKRLMKAQEESTKRERDAETEQTRRHERECAKEERLAIERRKEQEAKAREAEALLKLADKEIRKLELERRIAEATFKASLEARDKERLAREKVELDMKKAEVDTAHGIRTRAVDVELAQLRSKLKGQEKFQEGVSKAAGTSAGQALRMQAATQNFQQPFGSIMAMMAGSRPGANPFTSPPAVAMPPSQPQPSPLSPHELAAKEFKSARDSGLYDESELQRMKDCIKRKHGLLS